MLTRVSRSAFLVLLAATVPLISAPSVKADEVAMSGKGQCGTVGKWRHRDDISDPEFEQAKIKHIAKVISNKVEATPDQQKQISEIISSSHQECCPLKDDLRKQVHDMHELMSDPKSSDDQIKAQSQQVRASHEKLADQKLDTMLKIRDVLTPEQRAKCCPMHHHEHEEAMGGESEEVAESEGM